MRACALVHLLTTDPPPAQIDDIDIIKVDYPPCSAAGVDGCEVDQGFYNAYNSVHDDVRSAVANFSADHPSAKLYVTGHSLGAAMSMLAALDLSDQGFLIDALYVSPLFTLPLPPPPPPTPSPPSL